MDSILLDTLGWIKLFLPQKQGLKMRTLFISQSHQCDDFLNFPCHFLGAVPPAPTLYIHALNIHSFYLLSQGFSIAQHEFILNAVHNQDIDPCSGFPL